MNDTYGQRNRSYTLIDVCHQVSHQTIMDSPSTIEVDRYYIGTLIRDAREDGMTHTSTVPHTDGHWRAGIAGASQNRIHLYVRGWEGPAISVTALPTHMAEDERRRLVSEVVAEWAVDETLALAGGRTVLVVAPQDVSRIIPTEVLVSAVRWANALGEKHLRIVDSILATPSDEERRRNAEALVSLRVLERIGDEEIE